MNQNKLSELFTIPKGKLELAGSFYGSKVYTSDKLKEAYVNAIRKSSKGAPVYQTVEELVNRNVIVPAYKSKSFFRSILKLQPIDLEGISGVAIPDIRKIYILIETEANIFSFISNNALASVTIHEMVHLLSMRDKNFFYKTFNDEFKEFYSFYFCRIFSCQKEKIKKENLEKLCKFIYKIETGEFSTIMSFLKVYDTLIRETFKDASSLNEEDFNKMLHDFITSLYTIFKAIDQGSNNLIPRITVHFKNIYLPLYVTYKHIFGADLTSNRQIAFQELFAPSEIISTLTLVKSIPSKVYKALEKL